MSNNEHKPNGILEQARHRGLAKPQAGMSMPPQGYFDDCAARMAAALPYRPEAEEKAAKKTPRTLWQRTRPYVYLAAMFAGIWLMLQMFAMMGGTGHQLESIEDNTVIAEAVNNDDFFFDYYLDDISNYDAYSYYGDGNEQYTDASIDDAADADAGTIPDQEIN